MKRKVISMLLCATMAVSMVGCGGGSGDAPASTPAESEEAAEKVDTTAYIWYNIIIKYRRWYHG